MADDGSILVTGAAGQIGSVGRTVTGLLLDRGFSVRAMVRLETGYGSVYVRYPAVAEPLAFVLDIGPHGLQASAATFDQVRDGQILAALLPEAVRMTATNNRFGWLHANPWH